MDDIKVSAKKWKRTEGFDTNRKNKQPWYKNGIWYRKMCYAYNEEWNNENTTAKSWKNQNAWGEGK